MADRGAFFAAMDDFDPMMIGESGGGDFGDDEDGGGGLLDSETSSLAAAGAVGLGYRPTIVLMGLKRSGKTSIRKVSFFG
jgi:hypothetical protein